MANASKAYRRAGLMTAAASLALCSALAAPVWAQVGEPAVQSPADTTPRGVPAKATAAPNASAASGQTELEGVVVTARRTAERAQDIPVAVTSLSADQMVARQIRDLGDVAQYTPGLRFTGFLDSFNGNVTIRGLQQTNVQNAIGNVGVFLDGIYLQRGYMTDASLGDYQRIEVEKGPQTALYGQNTFSGAVNYVTNKPTDDFHGDATVSVGSAGYHQEQVGLGGPIVKGVLDARVYYGQSDYDGTWKNSLPGATGEAAHFGAYNKRDFSGAIDFKPIDRLDITASYSNLHKHEEILPFYTIDGTTQEDFLNCGSIYCGYLPTNPAATKTGVGHPPSGLFTEPQPDTNIYTRTWRVGAAYKVTDDLTLNYTFGDVRGTALEQASFAANAYNPTGLATISSQREGGVLTADSHEVRLVYNPSSPLKGEVGYFHSDTTDLFIFGLNFGVKPGQAIPSTGSDPSCLTCTTYPFTEQLTKYSVNSGFGRATYSFLDNRATLGAEIRYTSTGIEENDLLARKANPALPLLSNTYGDVTPTVTLDYKLDRNNMIYVSAAEGVKSGGFNGYVSGAVTLTKAEQSFGEESNWTYEAGWKSSLFQHRLTFAADVFYVDWSNRQVAVQPAGYIASSGATAVPSIYQASGNATDYGFELNGDLRATHSLSFNYSLSLQNPTDGKGSKILNVSSYCTGTICPANGDISGNTIGNVPKVSTAFGAEYRHNIDNMPSWLGLSNISGLAAYVGVDETYRGKIYTDDLNLTEIKDYWLTDGHAGLQRGNVKLFVWVKNALNAKYVESSFVVNSLKQYNVDFGEQRSFGITLSGSF